MAIMRFDPFRDLDRLAEQLFGDGRGLRMIPMEAYRRGDQFLVHLDLPGVRPEDVQLTVERNVVAIRAERRSPARKATSSSSTSAHRAPSPGSCSWARTWTPSSSTPAMTTAC